MSLVPCGRDGKKKQGALSPPLHDVEGTGRTCSQGLACRTFLSRISKALGSSRKVSEEALVPDVTAVPDVPETAACLRGVCSARGWRIGRTGCVRGPCRSRPRRHVRPGQAPYQGGWACGTRTDTAAAAVAATGTASGIGTRTAAAAASAPATHKTAQGQQGTGDKDKGQDKICDTHAKPLTRRFFIRRLFIRGQEKAVGDSRKTGNESVVARQKRRSGLGPCGELLRESAQGDLPGEPWTREALWRRDRRRKKGQAFCLNSSEFLSWPCQTSCQTFWQKRDRAV